MKTQSLLATALLSLLGCKEEAATSSAPQSMQTHRLGALEAKVPANWTPSPEDQRARLAAAAVRRDPGASAELLALSVGDSHAPALTLMTIEQTAAYSQSMGSVRDAFESVETAMREGAAARGAALEFEGSCATTSCDIFYQMGPTGARQRIWRAKGRIHSAGFTCAGEEGCAAMVKASLPAVSRDADSVDMR